MFCPLSTDLLSSTCEEPLGSKRKAPPKVAGLLYKVAFLLSLSLSELNIHERREKVPLH